MRSKLISAVVVLALSIAASGGFLSTATAQDERVVRVAADPWCPYNCEPGDPRPGFMVEVGREAFALSGYTLRYEVMSWSRALRESEVGHIDAAIGATRANAPRHTFGAMMLGSDETTLFVRAADAFEFKGVSSLAGRRLGVIKDYTYDDNGDIDAYIAANRGDLDRIIVVSSENNLDLLLRMLMAGRIDGFLENRYVGTYKAAEFQLSDRVALVSTGAVDFVSYAFTPSKRGEKLSRLFDEGVEALRKSGRFSEILNRYGLAEAIE